MTSEIFYTWKKEPPNPKVAFAYRCLHGIVAVVVEMASSVSHLMQEVF